MGESEEEEALSPRPADTILTTTLHIANVLANLGDQATRLATAPTGGNFWVSPTRQRHEKSQDDFDAGVREGQFEESSRLPQPIVLQPGCDRSAPACAYPSTVSHESPHGRQLRPSGLGSEDSCVSGGCDLRALTGAGKDAILFATGVLDHTGRLR